MNLSPRPAARRITAVLSALLAPLLVVMLGQARADAQAGGAPEVVSSIGGPVVIDARWIEGTPRRAEVDLVRGATRVRAYDGRTVRTAAAAVGDVVAVGYYHGGPEPLAGVVLVDLASGRRTDALIPVLGARSPHRPAGLVIASEATGFAIVMQEQQSDPSADVHTVFGRLALDGTWREAPHEVAIPWGLAALAATPTGTYELAVLYGGSGQAGQARICIVSLRENGQPSEHPWWASASASLTDVRMRAGAGGIDLFYRNVDGEITHHAFAHDGGWGQEPPAGHVVLRVRPPQAFFIAARDGIETAISFDP